MDVRRKSLFFILASVVFLCGMTDIKVDDIEMAILNKDYQEARQLSTAFLAKYPSKTKSQKARYYWGISQLYLGEYTEARGIFRKILNDKPPEKLYDRVYLGLIDSYYLVGDYDGALKNAKKLISRRKHSEFLSLVYLKIAKANLKLARWKEAKQYLNKIIEEFPESFELYLAQQLMEEKQHFSVQVGSFEDSEKSQALVEDLNEKGQYAYTVKTSDGSGRNFFRVRVGQLPELRQAQQLEQKLSKLGYPTRIYP